jgi:FixJ family two-component response regulator
VSQSTLTLVDALSEEAASIGLHASDDALRGQAALTRSIVDEVGRRHPSERVVAALHEQLGEELSRLAELAGVPARDCAAAESPLDVLVVDDDAATLHAIAMFVCDSGYACRTAVSSEDAIDKYLQRPAAIVISDWSMPGKSGLHLCGTLKACDPHVYFVLMTAHEDARALEGVRGCVDDFVSKPVDLDDLAVRLRAASRLVRAVRVVEKIADVLRARSRQLAAPPA